MALKWGSPLSLAKIWRIISHFWKRSKIGGKLVLITNRKSYISFRLLPKSVTLNDLERRYFTEIGKATFQHITASARLNLLICSVYGLGGTVPPSHISGPALYCIFSTVNTVIGLCLATKMVDLWRNLCASLLYFVVRVRCRRKKGTRSLSHLLVSFLSLISPCGSGASK